MSRIFLILLYIFFSCGCKRVSTKIPIQSYISWFEMYNNKYAEGEIFVISVEKSVSASFSYSYDKNKREIKGSLFAIFGLKVADFIITDSGIQVFNSKGDSIPIQKIISQNIIPSEVFINSVTYHFSFLLKKEATKLKMPDGELLSFKNYNILLHNQGNYPVKSIYLINGKNIETVFNNFKNINETFQPFSVIITAGNYKLEVQYRKVLLE